MKKRGFTIRIGPVAMSLAAAAVTAVAFAAVSLADNGSGSDSGGKDNATFTAPAPPGARGGAGVFFRDNLSDADRQKMEDFRNCMEENGAPGPPDPGHIDPGVPPKPPSAADREKLEKAWEACKDNLPEDMQKAGPPRLHTMGCGPGGPGAPGEGKKQNQEQSHDSGSGSSGSSGSSS